MTLINQFDEKKFVNIFGIRFLNANYETARSLILNGGLMVVPAAPALAKIGEEDKYYKALLKSDFAIPDSSLMVNLWQLKKLKTLKILSGQRFLYEFIRDDKIDLSDNIFLIDPNKEESIANRELLEKHQIAVDPSYQYIAPIYNKDNITDYKLLKLLKERNPKVILINLGGGVQERLGLFLKNNLTYRPSIICTGAAIAFFTGYQTRVPVWFDKIYLGWLMRCLSGTKYIRRYIKGLKLIPMILCNNTEKKYSQ